VDTELERIKQILLGEEYEALLRLQGELNDDDEFAERVAKVIAEALQIRSGADGSIANVLAPTIDRAIAGSINQDPKKLAESLYPVMGPAIRKSITETLQQMLDNFNQLLEQSFSPRSLRWRFDAWRTGRSYSEVVLLNTLEYQVEQVFLIHRESGLLIQHVYSEYAQKKDPDMVSGMLSAIQDFIEDSFSVSETDVLDTLRLGELTIVIQRGPYAVLAAVVRGRVPGKLRVVLASNLEAFHRIKRRQLQDYDGDPAAFADIELNLHTILEHKLKKKQKRKVPWLALTVLAVAVVFFGTWKYRNDQQLELQNTAREGLISLLNAEAGIVVLDHHLKGQEFLVSLLVDPDADDPEAIKVDQSLVTPVFLSKPFLSMDPSMVLLRAHRLLSPTNETGMKMAQNTLTLSGKATTAWLAAVKDQWESIAGIDQLDVSQLETYSPKRDEIDRLTKKIETITFQFPREGAEVDSNLPEFRSLVVDMKTAIELALEEFKQQPRFDIVGYTDETGSQRFNQRLGMQRAESLKKLLISNGIAASSMQTFSGLSYDEISQFSERKTKIIVHYEKER